MQLKGVTTHRLRLRTTALPSALANSPILPGADCRGLCQLWIPWGLSGHQILIRAPGFSSYVRPLLYGGELGRSSLGMYTDVSGRKVFRRHRGLVPSSLLQETFTPSPAPSVLYESVECTFHHGALPLAASTSAACSHNTDIRSTDLH